VSRVTVDTWASEARPGDTHGPDPVLVLQEGTNVRKWAYLKATPPWTTGQGVTVVSAVLRLKLAAAAPSDGSMTVQARIVEEAWTAATLAWKRRPEVADSDAATASIASAAAKGTTVDLDITAAMQAVADGAQYFGFRLIPLPGTTRGARKLISASGKPNDDTPELIITWTSPPDVPTGLLPAGGRFVSTRKPNLAWQFADAMEADPVQSGYQVQIDEATDFATPEFDTGQVTSGRSGLDLTSTAYAGLPTDGAVRYWRVRVADASGTWSDYSDPVAMRYCPLGVVAVTTPGATTPDFRPTVTWTFTPAALPTGIPSTAQRVWRARIERQVGTRWVTVADSGDVAGTETQWAPTVALPDTTSNYRAVVEVLDALDRAAASAAPDRAKDDQTFTWAAGGGATAPTGLVATVLEDAFVKLHWDRATTPDHYALVADGLTVVESFDAVAAPGGGWDYVWYGARPRELHALALHAVEVAGAVVSTSPPATTTAQTSPTGIWLVDAADGRAVHIAGKENMGGGLGERSSLHPRIGDRAPVLITELVRGYEGEVGGILVDWDGRIAREAKETLIALREDGVDLRLILGDLNLPVVVWDVEPNPTPEIGDERFDVGFSFAQRGEFERL
jgi:hypothetical protein